MRSSAVVAASEWAAANVPIMTDVTAACAGLLGLHCMGPRTIAFRLNNAKRALAIVNDTPHQCIAEWIDLLSFLAAVAFLVWITRSFVSRLRDTGPHLIVLWRRSKFISRLSAR